MTLAAAVIAALGLAGCVGGDPLPTLPPSPSSTPLFSSEEEALAAAEEAYAAYVRMSDLIASEGGAAPERIAPFVTDERLPEELEGFAAYRDHGIRTSGTTTVTVGELQQYSQAGPGAEVVFYVCVDGTGVRVLDQTGVDVTPPDRVAVGLREVVMVAPEGGSLLLETDTQWQSGSC